MSEKRDYKNLTGFVEFSHLNTPDTKFNPEGVFSVTISGLSDEAKVFLEGEGVKPNANSGFFKIASKYKPKVDLSLGDGEYEELAEDVIVGKGSKVVVNGFVLKTPRGNAFKLCGITVVELVEFIPDRSLDAI